MPKGRGPGSSQCYENEEEDAMEKALAKRMMMSSSSSDLSSAAEYESSDERAKSPVAPPKSVRCSARQAASKAAAFIAAAALEEASPNSPTPLIPIPEQGNPFSIYNAATNSDEELDRHLDSYTADGLAAFRQFRCKECGKVFKYKKCIKKHIWREHNVPPTKYLIELASSALADGGTWKLVAQHVEENQLENARVGSDVAVMPHRSGGNAVDTQELHLADQPPGIAGSFVDFQDYQSRENLLARTCHLCSKICSKPSDLNRHMMKHTGERPFQCPMCIRRFKAKRSMLYHMRSAHGAKVELSPALVDKLTSTKKYKKNRKKYDVEMDEESQPISENMSTDNSQGESVQQSREEGELSGSGLFIKTEPEDHYEESDDFHTSRDTGKDVSIKVQPYDFDNALENKITGVAVLQQTILTESAETHPMYVESLNQGHLIGEESEEEVDAEGGEESHVYSIASLKGPDGGKMPNVVKYKVNPRSEEILVTRMVGANIENGEKTYLYKCHWCAKVFLSLGKLQTHLTDHIRVSQKSFNCHVCGEIFQLKSLLQQHSKDHLKSPKGSDDHDGLATEQQAMNDSCSSGDAKKGEASFKLKKEVAQSDSEDQNESIPDADDALPRFFSPEELSQMVSAPLSVAIDSENMPIASGSEGQMSPMEEVSINGLRVGYRCRFCQKIFDRLFSLNRHLRVHTGIKPCYCKDCGRGFSEPRNLRHHVIRFHSDGSQRHLLRRSATGASQRVTCRRRFEISKPITGATRSSYLKKMAFLNAGVFSEYASFLAARKPLALPHLPQKEDSANGAVPSTDCGQNQRKNSSHVEVAKSHPAELDGLAGDDKVTVIYPTAVHVKSEISASDGKRVGAASPQSDREILSDPKRSLIGSLRKPKSPKNVSPPHTSTSATSVIRSVHSAWEQNICAKPEEIELAKPPSAFNQVATAASKLSFMSQQEPLQPRKQKRSRGNNKYFSTYSPRLHQVEKPAGRADACRPQVLPDGKSFYECSYCHKAFASVSDVNRHMDFHEDVRPYKCEFCNYCSRTNSQLKVHKMRHQGIKQYLCDLCNYCGVTQSDLKRHNRSQGHLIRSRHVCDWCGLGHVTRQQKVDHMNSCCPQNPGIEHCGKNVMQQVIAEPSMENYKDLDNTLEGAESDDKETRVCKKSTSSDNEDESDNSFTTVSKTNKKYGEWRKASAAKNSESALSGNGQHEDSTARNNLLASLELRRRKW